MKKNSSNQKRFPIRWFSAVAAACLILMVGLWGGSYYQNNLVVDSIVDIDVNPSIELTTNKRDKVIDAVPVNEDAEAILDGMSLKNTDLNVAVNAIVGAMVQKGYLFGDENSILVSVQNQDETKASEIQTLVLSGINTSLQDNQVEAAVINQTVTETTDAAEFAKNHNISLGKAVFILNLAAKDASLDPEQMASMSLRELAALVEEKNIDISDIADYDMDDSIWENIADAVEEVDEENAAAQTAAITKEKAQEIALNHAGVSADQATKMKVELEDEDGVPVYEVEFYAGNVEYQYKINGSTGAILKYEQEKHDNNTASSSSSTGSSTTGSTTNNTTSSTTQTTTITKEKALEIALNHAGVSSSNAKVVKNELDKEDGVQVYEVKFLSGNVEYYYEINASSGKILKYEQEKNGSATSSSTTSSTTQTTTITKEKAQEIALNHAGVSASQATKMEVELEDEDGVPVYEVEFCSGNVEYQYKINGSTGAILKYEQEKHA